MASGKKAEMKREKTATKKTPKWDDVVWLGQELARASRASEKACERRMLLPPGSSRARVTTANAKWMRATEYRDRVGVRLMELGGAVSVSVALGIGMAVSS